MRCFKIPGLLECPEIYFMKGTTLQAGVTCNTTGKTHKGPAWNERLPWTSPMIAPDPTRELTVDSRAIDHQVTNHRETLKGPQPVTVSYFRFTGETGFPVDLQGAEAALPVSAAIP
jgi:hypothetical protein